MLRNLKNDGILHIVLKPWRANISLYKNVVVAHIFLYKNTYSTLSLTVANDQITSVCTQILKQAVVMVVYGSKNDQDGRKCSRITLAFSPFNYRNSKNLYVFLWDENFALTRQLVKPNSQRDQGKNALATTGIASTDEFLKKKFGILINRWCVFLSTILLPNESVRSLMHAAIVLNS